MTTVRVQEHERLLISFVAALAIHGVVLFFFAPNLSNESTPFDAPLYVQFEPVELATEADTPTVDEAARSELVEDRPIEAEPEPEPEPEIAPDELLASSEPAVETRPEPASETVRRTDAAEVDESPAPAATESVAEPSVSPPVPPPPVPTRTLDFSDESDLFVSSNASDEQLQALIESQAVYTELLEEYQRTQSQAANASEDASLSGDMTERSSALTNRIAALARALAADDRNVLQVGPEDAQSGEESPSGITVEGPGGSRQRLDSRKLDLSDLALPPFFPSVYLVEVVFSVDSAGSVVSARLVNRTGSEELDRRLVRFVRSWQFEPSGGDGIVEGRVPVVVSTKVLQ